MDKRKNAQRGSRTPKAARAGTYINVNIHGCARTNITLGCYGGVISERTSKCFSTAETKEARLAVMDFPETVYR